MSPSKSIVYGVRGIKIFSPDQT